MRSRHRQPAPLPVLDPVDAPGVVYFQEASAGALKFFRCAPHEMTLSQRGCGARWRAAQVATGEVAEAAYACRTCPVGAAHAGAEHIASSRLFGAKICPRCRMGATRIIGNRVCVSCYNRERERLAGRNARGNLPSELLEKRPLISVEFVLTVDGVSQRHRVDNVVDTLEAVLQVLRTTKGVITFAPIAPPPPMAQGDLFVHLGIGGGAWAVRRRARVARRPRIVADQGELWPMEMAA